jgi:hypothetical protein
LNALRPLADYFGHAEEPWLQVDAGLAQDPAPEKLAGQRRLICRARDADTRAMSVATRHTIGTKIVRHFDGATDRDKPYVTRQRLAITPKPSRELATGAFDPASILANEHLDGTRSRAPRHDDLERMRRHDLKNQALRAPTFAHGKVHLEHTVV